MQRSTLQRYNPVNSSDEVADNNNTANVATMNEKANLSGPKLTESEIDAILDIRTAMKTCRKHNVNYSAIEEEDVSIFRLLLKLSFLCEGTTRAQIEDKLNEAQNTERPRMDNMCTLYREAHQLITENDTIVSQMRNQNILSDFKNRIENLEKYISPILILGETGAGKTSFINLLLGERLLPTSTLSNTHTICELSYSPSGSRDAVVEYVCQTPGTGVKISLKDNPNAFVELNEGEVKNKRVQKITVQGPFDILKHDVVIVDSPGDGESTEMTDMVLGYVEKAAAFIFVIDIMNAGGVQQRVQEFIEKVKEKAQGIHGSEVKSATMFVCNKLDEVPPHEKDRVIQDTVKRLQKLWDGSDSIQIIPFSTTEAQWIQDHGAVAPNFRKVLEKLAVLIPTARHVTTLKAKTWLGNLLDESLYIAGAHIENSTLSEEEILERKAIAERRLVDLETNLHVFISQQKDKLATRIQKGATEMFEIVNTEQTKTNLCSYSFTKSALPTDKTWHDAAANIRTQLFGNVITAMNIQKFAEKIEGQIKDELAFKIPSFESSLRALRVTFSGRNETVIEEKTTQFLPEYVRKVYGNSVGLTVLLTAAMPFIALGRLPVFLAKRFKESREMSAMEKKYETANGKKEQIKEVCEKYAKHVFQHVVQKMEIQALATESLQVCYGRLDELKNEMTETIGSDRKFLRGFPKAHKTIRSMAKMRKIKDQLECLKRKDDEC